MKIKYEIVKRSNTVWGIFERVVENKEMNIIHTTSLSELFNLIQDKFPQYKYSKSFGDKKGTTYYKIIISSI